MSYGAVLNAAAVVLTAYGNVPPGRAAQVMAMLLGVPVSPGWVDKASGRGDVFNLTAYVRISDA